MASGSLGTDRNSSGQGLTALGYRRILQALYPNVGVIDGLAVTPNQNLTYNVAGGVGVGTLGDGNRLFWTDGGTTPAVSTGDANNPRIDIIYARIHDPNVDSGKVDVELGVASGTPSTSPVPPSLQSSMVPLMSFLVRPGVTNLATGTSAYGTQQYAVPYGGTLDVVGEGVNYTGGVPVDGQWHTVSNITTMNLPTDRRIMLVWSMKVLNPGAGDSIADFALRARVDDVIIDPDDLIQIPISKFNWTQQHLWFPTISAGVHHVAFDVVGDGNGVPQFNINGGYSKAIDIGVAQ